MSWTDEVLSSLGGKKQSWGASVRCPSHDDKHPSLDITERNGQRLFTCRAGCPQDAVLEALKAASLWPTNGHKKYSWTIRNAGGAVLATKHREDTETGKRIHWDPRGAKPAEMLYGAERTQSEYVRTRKIVVCEGEKAADAARALGLQAVGTVGGASSTPSKEALACLDGFGLVLWPDFDAAGAKHMGAIAQALGRNVQLVDTSSLWQGQDPAGQDAADLLELPAGGLPTTELAQVGRRLIRMSADKIEAKRVEWLVEGYVPLGMTTILAGDPDTGKSFLSLDWCASLSRTGGRSVYMCFEDAPEYTLVPRLEALGADMSRVEFVNGMVDGDHETSFTSEHLDLVDELLAESPAKLLVIDPIQAFTSSGVDVHRDNQVRAIMTPLGKLAAKHRCAVLIVMHLRKPMGSDKRTRVSIHDVRNSGDYVGAARSVLGVAYKSGDQFENTRMVHHIKSNVAPKSPSFEFSIYPETGYQGSGVPRAGSEQEEPVWI